jgi:hypothetical protein
VVLALDLSPGDSERIRDGSLRGNAVRVAGRPGAGVDGTVFPNGSTLVLDRPEGFDFGQGAFAVRAEVTPPERYPDELAFICMGKYPGNPLGWQLYVHAESGRVRFNARSPVLDYVGLESDEPLAPGQRVEIVGVRDACGRVFLMVDGRLQSVVRTGATRAYGPAASVHVGAQHNGTWAFGGTIHYVSVDRDGPAAETVLRDALRHFWERLR